jgi:hypothetical protein
VSVFLRVKSLKFERAPIEAANDRARRRVFMKLGAFVRQHAITSMVGHPVRKGFGVKSKVTNRMAVSEPGQPPAPHTGDLVKRIFFALDEQAASVVIGPAAFREGKAPALLEQGGEGRFFRRFWRRGVQILQAMVGHFRPRPFMVPALGAGLKELPGLLPNCFQR